MNNQTDLVSVGIPLDIIRDIKVIADRDDITATDVLRRAIATEKILRQNANNNVEIVIKEPKHVRKETRKVIIKH